MFVPGAWCFCLTVDSVTAAAAAAMQVPANACKPAAALIGPGWKALAGVHTAIPVDIPAWRTAVQCRVALSTVESG